MRRRAPGITTSRPTRDASWGAGQAARAKRPLAALGTWRPAADRPDPVALLEEQAVSRVPELIPVRYGRMGVSPFTFYRGAALPMAADLAANPTTGLIVQLCGWALARGHARSGEPATIAGYLGEDADFDHAMGSFAETYADQTERDFAAFSAAITSGRLTAETGV